MSERGIIVVAKGPFGFLERENRIEDEDTIFVHRNAFSDRSVDNIIVGHLVEFDWIESQKKPGSKEAANAVIHGKRELTDEEKLRQKSREKKSGKKNSNTEKEINLTHNSTDSNKNESHKNSLSKLNPTLVRDYEKMNNAKLNKKYGGELSNKKSWKKWNETSRVFLSEYSEVHEVVPFHPEEKFRGTIIPWNNFIGWQGFIWCPEVNSLIYMRQDSTRESGSIVKGAKVDFILGVSLDNRGDLQFVARDWESGANRGDAPESAITVNYNSMGESKESIIEILQDSNQFVLITSYHGDQDKATSEQITSKLNKLFPNYPTQVLDWPGFSKFPNSKNIRRTHPLLFEWISGAVVLFPPEIGGEEE